RRSFDVAVVGAGIVGCATAWELARRGVSVCLLDRESQPANATTGLGEGNVLCCDKQPGPELELTKPGLALYAEIEALLGDEAGIRRKGALVVHSGRAGWDAEQGRVSRMRAAGVSCELLEAAAVRSAEPELTGGILGASWFPGDLQCAPRAIARALAREAADLGATLLTGLEVDRIALHGSRVVGVTAREGRSDVGAGCVVLAGGPWSAPLAATAGLRMPLEPRKGQLLRLERRPGFLSCKVIDGSYMAAVADPGEGLLVSPVIETTLDGHVLVGSSRERRGFDLSVDPAVSAALLERAALLAPGLLDLKLDSAWAGLRPWLPGGLPAIGPSAAAEGLWVATGHEGAGVAHGPITGRLIAQGICGEPAELDLAPFDPDRFS
ncbi:MAG: FAD-binding oxidoreductase, partial [Actinomycetota bacterium]|nr:FAD-binding oxidoreductase [Actinomycetota bacterium]